MAISYEDIVQGAYGSVGRTGIGGSAGQIDQEGYNFWLNALKAGVVTADQLLANFNQAVAGTIQQQPNTVNSQAVAAYIEANPLATQIDPKKVVAVGDSTTWGYSNGNQVTENMVTTAQKALGSDYSVSNLGINSTTVGDFLNSSDFDKALSSGAGTVVLNYGMNEAYRNENPATFAKNLLTAVQTLQAVGKKVILQTPNSTSSTDDWAQNVGAYADVVRSVSQQTGSTLDDKFTYTSGLTNATSAADPVHPTAATYSLLGTNLADAIKTTTTGVAPKAISVTPPVAAAQTQSLVTNQATAAPVPAPGLLTPAPAVPAAPVAEATTSKEDAVTKIKNQILAQGTTSQWSGQGIGSAEANAADMAKMLASADITDINQLGKVPLYEKVEEIGKTYNGLPVRTYYNEDGTSRTVFLKKEPDGKSYAQVAIPKDAKLETVYGQYVDDGRESGGYYNAVDASKLKTVDGKLVGDTGQTTFGNKLTGKAIANNYEIGSNAFGGTSAGKGTTGYRVNFDAEGKPLFYTTYKSDEDFKQYAPFLAIAGLGLAAPSLFATGGAAAGAGSLTAGVTLADIAASDALLSGLTAAQASSIGAAAPSLFAGAPGTGLGLEFAGSGGLFDLANAGIAGGTSAFTAAELAALTGGSELLSSATGLGLESFTAAELASAVPPVFPPSGLPPSVITPLVSSVVNSVLNSGGTGTTNLGSILNTGLTTGAGLLQQQTSREAALAAQQRIDAETAAAKTSAAFRPVGMTTRFGTSKFQVDPVTGQLTSAGYTLSPEAKAQQDRFVALSNQGLTQAEQAQTQFAPLQTGATNLFNLGNKYLAQTPQDVAQNYLAQQMSLLQPGRELEFANLQTKLRNQGRLGLSVSQGGGLGATTPELQALYNARARQEAELAANAQLAGQRDVAFGAGLLDQGSRTMGQYYGGQQAAYAPYNAAMGQVQNLETLGQQPYNMSNALAQQTSTAGARAGALGLEGANISQRLATGSAATTNPYSTALGGVASNPAFGQLLGGLFSSGAPINALSSSAYGPGMAGYESMLQDIYG